MALCWRTLVVLAFTALMASDVWGQGWELRDQDLISPIESEHTCASVRYKNKCYYFGLSMEWWFGAVEQCKKIGYHLARIRSLDEANFLARYLKHTRFRTFWIDATDEKHEGIWLGGDRQPSFLGWFAAGEPNGEWWENCGELVVGDQGHGRMNDQRCQEWRKYICERNTQLVCPKSGYQDRCYWFSMHPSNWYQAREHCQSMGMRLARIGGADQSSFIAQQITTDSAWVDVRYGATTGGFTYSDGARLSSNWLQNSGLQPFSGITLQKCGEVRKHHTIEGRISGSDCQAMRHFVCERAPMAPSSAGTNADELLGLPNGLASSSAIGRRKRAAPPLPSDFYKVLMNAQTGAN